MHTYNYEKKRFADPPTDYYLRPYYLAMDSKTKDDCYLGRVELEVYYEYLLDFIRAISSLSSAYTTETYGTGTYNYYNSGQTRRWSGTGTSNGYYGVTGQPGTGRYYYGGTTYRPGGYTSSQRSGYTNYPYGTGSPGYGGHTGTYRVYGTGRPFTGGYYQGTTRGH
ncbi:unnamed protein product [Oppiella nova]|uniref:Uncharacterized protein n=1 Tax=Oppiella nova TaxID=334625 RepID=A0A7R9LPD6_9ACAR|nr:unnamed protein product [Oppiella nova]CAG2165647.1 unnamed protein product [Oppiella nova]